MLQCIVVEDEHKGIGAIDALTSGFNLIARRPWAILLPLAANLFTWLGPKLSVSPLTRQAADALRAGMLSQTGQYAETVQYAAQSLVLWGDNANLFNLVAAGMPGLALSLEGRPEWMVASWAAAAALVVALLAGGIYLMALYLGIIAQQVRGDGMTVAVALARAGRVVWRVAVLGVVLLGIATVITLPGMGMVGVLSLFSYQGAMILSSLLVWGALLLALWTFFYLFFVIDAIVLDDVGVRQAVSRSLALVRRNSGASLFLILITILLTLGLGVVWNSLAGTTLGAVAAIVASVYVGSSLAAASLIFYSSRWYALRKQYAAAGGAPLAGSRGKNQADQSDE